MRCSERLSSFSGARRASPVLAAALLLGAAGCGNVVLEDGNGTRNGETGSGGTAGSGAAGGNAGGDAGSAGAGPGCSAKPWGRGFPDAYSYEYGESIALDSACNVIVAGSFGGTMDVGGAKLTGQDEDLFLVKLDGAGHHLWSKAFGIEPFQGSARVAVDPQGNILLAGTFDGLVDFGTGPLLAKQEAIYVAKLDPSGNPLWAREFGGGIENEASAVTVDAAGSVLIAGYFTGTVDFGTGPLGNDGAFHPYAVRLDPNGKTQWATAFTGDGARATGIASDPTGRTVLVGHFQSSLKAGAFDLTDIGNGSFVAWLEPDGSVSRATTIGGTGERDAEAVTVDAWGFALVAGNFDGSIDVGTGPQPTKGQTDGFVVAYEPSGMVYWSRTFGGPGLDAVTAMGSGVNDGTAITGVFTGEADFDGDMLSSFGPSDGFLAMISGNQTFTSARRFGGADSDGADGGAAVAVGPDGAAYVTGTFKGDTDFGSGPSESAGGFDVFVAKYVQ